MKLYHSFTLLFIAFFAMTTSPMARIINVPDDFETIQEAIGDANNADTVLVEPDTYVENINFGGRNITVASLYLTTGDEGFIDETIIDGGENGSVVTFRNREAEDAVLCGFTLQNGSGTVGRYDHLYGGGIYIYSSTPTITHCSIINNNGRIIGAGIFCEFGANATLSYCNISDNTTAGSAAGIGIDRDSSPTLSYCIITRNQTTDSGGGLYIYDGDPIISQCLITQNTAGGVGAGIICYHNSNLTIINCTISDNTADTEGGGIWLGESNLIIENTILWNNAPQEISYQEPDAQSSHTDVSYSDIEGGEDAIETNDNGDFDWGEGNLDEDPLFVDPDEGDFHLAEDTPCIDTGNPESPLDPDLTRADMGCFWFDQQGNHAPEIIVDPVSLEAEESSEHVINISNVGDWLLRWVIADFEVDWLSTDQLQSIIEPDTDVDFIVTFDDEGLERGAYETVLHILSNDPETPDFEVDIIFYIEGGERPQLVEQPVNIEVDETEEITFDVRGLDEGGDELELSFTSNLPEDAEFEVEGGEEGNIEGHFRWQTTYDDAGEYSVVITLTDGVFTLVEEVFITVYNVNRAPQVINPIDDIEIQEDSGMLVVADLDEVFFDPDGEMLDYVLLYDVGSLLVQITNENRMVLVPLENYNGITLLRVVVMDSEVTLTDTISVLVNPVNDLPTSFHLISPEDSSYTSRFPDVEFTWLQSVDVVEDSVVSYDLLITSVQKIYWYRRINETLFSVSRELLSDPDESTLLTWEVWAHDGEDSVRCDRAFHLMLAPLSVSEIEPLPTAFEVRQPYPNPFNSSTMVELRLPREMPVTMTAYDLNGRQVAVILDKEVSAGTHRVQWVPAGLPSGTYILMVDAPMGILSMKMSYIR